jgi:hypothetical protein
LRNPGVEEGKCTVTGSSGGKRYNLGPSGGTIYDGEEVSETLRGRKRAN